MADITLINLNMLFVRYGEQIERELHVPLGCLYLTRALEAAGFAVDFRDYQCCPSDDPFDLETFLGFLAEPAPVVGLSCMANLLPFTLQAAGAIKAHWPDRTVVLGGVGSKSVEEKILRRFEGIDVICRGEGELTAPDLLGALRAGRDLEAVAGISFRRDGQVVHTPDRPRIADLDSIAFPAWEKIDLARYAGYGMMTSRGCPYPCTFCSVAPVWNTQSHSRGPKDIVAEMAELHRRAGVGLFLFQDEFFVSGKAQVMEFCRELSRARLEVKWKAFGRVNLTDRNMMLAMAENGCVELRFGIESGSDKVLTEIRKGFTVAEVLKLIPQAIEIFPRVDAFYVWGFPFETMADFGQSLFQMINFRTMGARILPSLLCLLPQTQIYRDWADKLPLEFCPWLLPEFVFTGHEVTRGGEVEILPRHAGYFRLIQDNPDIFPGFFHMDLKNNVLPKLAMLRRFGFYPESQTSRRSCWPASRKTPPKAAARTPRGSNPRNSRQPRPNSGPSTRVFSVSYLQPRESFGIGGDNILAAEQTHDLCGGCRVHDRQFLVVELGKVDQHRRKVRVRPQRLDALDHDVGHDGELAELLFVDHPANLVEAEQAEIISRPVSHGEYPLSRHGNQFHHFCQGDTGLKRGDFPVVRLPDLRNSDPLEHADHELPAMGLGIQSRGHLLAIDGPAAAQQVRDRRHPHGRQQQLVSAGEFRDHDNGADGRLGGGGEEAGHAEDDKDVGARDGPGHPRLKDHPHGPAQRRR